MNIDAWRGEVVFFANSPISFCEFFGVTVLIKAPCYDFVRRDWNVRLVAFCSVSFVVSLLNNSALDLTAFMSACAHSECHPNILD